MSWQAQRYADQDKPYVITERARRRIKREGRDDVITKHHVPPRHPDPQPQFLLQKDERHHRAYHLLFKAAATFEDAVAILKNDWWTPEQGEIS